MKTIITCKGITLTDSLKNSVNSKLTKLDKFFTKETTAIVTLKIQKNSNIVEITIPVKGNVIRSEMSTDDMYKSIDLSIDIILKQIKKYKTKIKSKRINSIVNSIDIGDFSEEPIDYDDDEDEIKIVKRKHYALKPMDPIEACMQAELINHEFFIFKNSETDNICLIYKRRDGSYGLITPEEE